MKVPKYIQDIISGFEYDFDHHPISPGYTIKIYKPSIYMKIPVFKSKVERLLNWAQRNHAEAFFNYIPSKTRYCKQFIVITVTDPVMMSLEKYK